MSKKIHLFRDGYRYLINNSALQLDKIFHLENMTFHKLLKSCQRLINYYRDSLDPDISSNGGYVFSKQNSFLLHSSNKFLL